MNINFKDATKSIISLLSSQKYVAIIIKGSPDPDAIASSYFFFKLCSALDIKASMISFMPPSLPSNKELISMLNIPLDIERSIHEIDIQQYSGYIICDYQTAVLEHIVDIPCIIHIDHHSPADFDVPAQFRILTDEVSSTSTLCTLMLPYCLSLIKEDVEMLATALYLGIKTDTDGFIHAGKYDVKATEYLAQFCNMTLIEKIENTPLTPYALSLLQKAMNSAIVYKNWMIAGVGFVDERFRDTIAIIADHLLQNNPIELVVVYGAIYHNNRTELDIDASLRTRNEDFDLNTLIKHITPDGGGRKFKGAFQIHIDYFVHCPDQDKLWEIIEMTTHHILTNLRDRSVMFAFQSTYNKMKNAIKRLFTK